MIRFLGLIRRRPGLTFDAFTDHWRTTHRNLVLEFSTPGPISGYVQNRRVPDALPGLVSDYDGSPELWIRDWEGLGELGASERFQYIANDDSELFIDMPPISFLTKTVFESGYSRSDVVGKIKLMLFWQRPKKEDSSGKSLEKGWQTKTTPLLLPQAKPLRLERDAAIAPPGGNLEECEFLGVESSWWPDEASLTAAWNSRALDIGPAPSALIVVREEVACPPSGFDMLVR